jgi:hypothetical protein
MPVGRAGCRASRQRWQPRGVSARGQRQTGLLTRDQFFTFSIGRRAPPGVCSGRSAPAMGYRLHDRRARNRPANGDTAICPKCRIGTIEFNERYRVVLLSGKTASMPGWVCDHGDCHYERAARKSSDRIPLNNATVEPRPRSSRQLMKARDVLQRARRTLANSVRRKRARR